MSKKKAAPDLIRLRGVRQNNLKNFDLDLPLHKLIVVTGLSGSGKSSLAFDTLFAEGQRRYIETFSPYARQFLDRMDKPRVDSIEGIPPAIAIEQRNSVRTTRSTVGTMTEICDYAKMIWPFLSALHCRQCGAPVRKDAPRDIWKAMGGGQASTPAGAEVLITFELPLSEKLSLDESLALVARQGYQRLLIENELVRLEDAQGRLEGAKPLSLVVVQDRLELVPARRTRFIEAAEQAYHFGKGKLALHFVNAGAANKLEAERTQYFSNRFHCANCDIEYREPTPALFSFNHPLGACPACRGFGRTIAIDYDLALPDRTKTLAQGVVRPWLVGHGLESQQDLLKFCRKRSVPTDVPFRDLPKKFQRWVIDGDVGYGKDEAHQWPRAWYGVKGYFRWLESKAYKMHVRVLLSRYRTYTRCPACDGRRFQPDTLLFLLPVGPRAESPDRIQQLTIADFYALPVSEALAMVETLAAGRAAKKSSDPLALALTEVRSRLAYLVEAGLGYLTLDRPTRSLSGGETERVNLTTSLGSRLVNTLFVLDEPSVGLHARDTARLVKIVQRLRDAGNTVLVVEHEPGLMRAADQIIDLGPGHGEAGGDLVFQGSPAELLKDRASITGHYLSGRKRIELAPRRAGRHEGCLRISNATVHNLKNFAVEIPLGRLVGITGVSGSGKTTLIRDVLLPALTANFEQARPDTGASAAGTDNDEAAGEDDGESASPASSAANSSGARLEGGQNLGGVVLVDQSALGRTPRSNPAVYIGAFDFIRELFAESELARRRGLGAGAFSFNSAQGQCERCRGAGFEKIEMQFLSDVFVRCPECDGRRYRPHILAVKIGGQGEGKNIADILEMTVDEAIEFFSSREGRAAQRAVSSLRLLEEVGLGYLRLGQPINTLSGGESQRLKLVSHLAEFKLQAEKSIAEKPTLFLFDEPTTGLHFEDVRVLLKVFQRLVDTGHSVVVIEHNLDVIKSADWLIDLGPEAGEAGGRLVAEGTPESIMDCRASHTGAALRGVLSRRKLSGDS
jgi:excinuclease ABC subunit A